MTRQISFSKYEQKLRPEYRQKMNSAESTEHVKKFFVRTVLELFERVLGDRAYFNYEDVHLDPKRKDGFVISKRVREGSGSNLHRLLPKSPFAWSKTFFDKSEACSRRFENLPFGLKQFKSQIFRCAKIY